MSHQQDTMGKTQDMLEGGTLSFRWSGNALGSSLGELEKVTFLNEV